MLTFKLPTDITVYTVNGIFEQFLALLEQSGSSIVFDLSATEEIDGCGLQLLVYMDKETMKQRKSLSLVTPSEELIDSATLLHLEHALPFHIEGASQ